MKKKNFFEAVKEEMQSHQKMKTKALVPRPKNTPIIKNKWVFRVKTDSEGNPERFKAKLVSKGFSQTKGIDYDEKFSPVVRMETIRFLLATAASNNKNYEMIHMDVKTAFLHGELEENIFMEQPEGISKKEGFVCKLNKSIYGLKQSPRCWNQKFTNFMKQNNFIQSTEDPCLFIKTVGNEKIYLAVNVDDCIILGQKNLARELKKTLSNNFEMRDLGNLSCILGIQIERDENGITMNQTKYILKVLERFNMKDCKGIDTPIQDWLREEKEEEDFKDKVLFQQAVGSINFLAVCTRPDISFAVSQISKFMHQPKQTHWIALKRVFRYLKKTKDFKLFFSEKQQNVHGFSDASFANDSFDRKSHSGYVFFKNNGAISWKSKKQSIVALSTMEAEYIALSNALKEALSLQRMEKSVQIKNPGEQNPITIFEDNQSAINTSNNLIRNDRSKHIDVRFHFIREKVANKEVQIKCCQSSNMVADILTKPLGKILFSKHCRSLGLVDFSMNKLPLTSSK